MICQHESRQVSGPWKSAAGLREWRPGRMTLSYDLTRPREPVDTLGPVDRGAPTVELLTATPRFHTVLVPLDGTPFAEHALPRALGIVRRSGGSLRLIHVLPSLQSTPQRVALWMRDTQSEYLEGVRKQILRVASVPIETEVLEGDRSEQLGTALETSDVVVMATHSRGLLSRFFCGSLADALIRRTTKPVLLVRGHNSPVDLTGDPLLQKILLPLDGTASAEEILEPALRLGQPAGAEYTLLRVVGKKSPFCLGRAGGSLPAIVMAQEPRESEVSLRRLTTRLRRLGAASQARLVWDDGSVANAIVNCAKAIEADVIALTTNGHQGMSRWLTGSMAHQVLQRSTTPLLVCQSLPVSVESSP